jgi:hypothetical protein
MDCVCKDFCLQTALAPHQLAQNLPYHMHQQKQPVESFCGWQLCICLLRQQEYLRLPHRTIQLW